MKVFLNGKFLHETSKIVPIAPMKAVMVQLCRGNPESRLESDLGKAGRDRSTAGGSLLSVGSG